MVSKNSRSDFIYNQLSHPCDAARVKRAMRNHILFFLVWVILVSAPAYADVKKELCDAAAQDDLVRVKGAVERGADVNKHCGGPKHTHGKTVLMLAARRVNVDMARYLIDHGANLNARDQRGPEGMAALDFALEYPDVNGQRLEVVRLLLDKGADAGANDASALRAAALWQLADVAKLLLEHGAASKPRAEGAVAAIATFGQYNNIEMVKLLIQKGVDVNAMFIFSNARYTPLQWLASSDKIDIIKLLIDNGADVNSKGESGRSPLYLAVFATGSAVRGAKSDAAKLQSARSEAAAVIERHRAIVRLIIERGADVNMKNAGGLTALGAAKGDDITADMLRKAGARETQHVAVPVLARKKSESYDKYLSVSDVEKASGYNGIKQIADDKDQVLHGDLNFADEDGKKILAVFFQPSDRYESRKKLPKNYKAQVEGVGEEAFQGPDLGTFPPTTLVFRKGDYCVSLITDRSNKHMLALDQLVAIAKIIASRI